MRKFIHPKARESNGPDSPNHCELKDHDIAKRSFFDEIFERIPTTDRLLILTFDSREEPFFYLTDKYG